MKTNTLVITSHTKDYDVVTYDTIDTIGDILTIPDSLVICDRKVWNLYRNDVLKSIDENNLYLIDALESNKTIDTALDICDRMTSIKAKRNATIVSIGGGIIQDITGFAANILYRGVKWVFIPTTLLSACDSCIGGKTSLNFRRFKNLLGTFFAPDHIHIYPELFHTLSDEDYLSGLGEVVKFNFLLGETGIRNIEAHIDSLISRDGKTLEQFLISSLSFKKKYIEEDEFDWGVRIHLNFAHTFGHAIETVTNYAIPHGSAVAIGTIAANRVSLLRGWISQETTKRMENLLLKIIPQKYGMIDVENEQILNAMKKDKKQVGDSITVVLLREKDNVALLRIVSDTTEDELLLAINYAFALIRG